MHGASIARLLSFGAVTQNVTKARKTVKGKGWELEESYGKGWKKVSAKKKNKAITLSSWCSRTHVAW